MARREKPPVPPAEVQRRLELFSAKGIAVGSKVIYRGVLYLVRSIDRAEGVAGISYPGESVKNYIGNVIPDELEFATEIRVAAAEAHRRSLRQRTTRTNRFGEWFGKLRGKGRQPASEEAVGAIETD